jgi:hypothetical protein
MHGRPRVFPDHAMSNRERQQRWRAKHLKPPAPKPPKLEPFPGLKSLEELWPEPPPEPPPFDPAALIG